MYPVSTKTNILWSVWCTAYNLHLRELYSLNSLSDWKGLTKFMHRDLLNSTLIYSILFKYAPQLRLKSEHTAWMPYFTFTWLILYLDLLPVFGFQLFMAWTKENRLHNFWKPVKNTRLFGLFHTSDPSISRDNSRVVEVIVDSLITGLGPSFYTAKTWVYFPRWTRDFSMGKYFSPIYFNYIFENPGKGGDT